MAMPVLNDEQSITGGLIVDGKTLNPGIVASVSSLGGQVAMTTTMPSDAERIVVLQAEVKELNFRLETANHWRSEVTTPAWTTVWTARGWSALTYLSHNKAMMVAVLALAGVAYHHLVPGAVPLDTVAIEKDVDDAVAQHNANIDKKVQSAVDARPVPPPIIQQVPFSPGAAK